MEMENIYQLLIAILPSATSIIGCIVAIIRSAAAVKAVKKAGTAEVKVLEEENIKLREQVKELALIAYKNNEDVQKVVKTVKKVVDRIDEGEI